MTEIYPRDLIVDTSLPDSDQFAVTAVDGRVGRGIRANIPFGRGTRVAKFAGTLSNTVFQHSLQVSPETHLHDPYFVGLLSHSCAPNCVLDMQRLEILALLDIEPGELLTIDYAVTEDTLYRQFPCNCGSSHCRRWITGRREAVNEEGRAYLAQLAAKLPRVHRGAR
ncbi:SET domain-containing protein-lysine N-methyltransferase [Magnetospirillum sp. ME-1]|uniref:SET domain-containing protein-lysine N-methyltransferase n=1 Tax=Magnetospirillum sp. ME-1 TaxID=1639348 RepID=UPI000A17CD1F|nr:SET domain-containing protein-lysine N-methyltransferase [Magnetospirillum sp. ME-1]ARJ64224.1 SET domain-containing protein-lysine N-methyltransferase [Magnetospirillum sp. ME-1]